MCGISPLAQRVLALPLPQILHALDDVSLMIEEAVHRRQAARAAGRPPAAPADRRPSSASAGEDDAAAAAVVVDEDVLGEEVAPPWPVYITLADCNVTLADALPQSMKEGGAPEGLDLSSPNPFLKSFNTLLSVQPVRGAPHSDSSGSLWRRRALLNAAWVWMHGACRPATREARRRARRATAARRRKRVSGSALIDAQLWSGMQGEREPRP